MTQVRVRTRTANEPAALPERAYDRQPRMQLTVTDETLWLTRYDALGQPEVTYPVTVGDVANCFQGLGGMGSGLLPDGILFWQATEKGAATALWVPPAVRTIAWAVGKRVRRLTIPLPGFVFVGLGLHYSIYAALERPQDDKARLFHAPLSNVNDSGLICAGTVKFPRCTPAALAAAAALFFESEFNADLSSGKVVTEKTLFNFLRSLKGKRRFPLAVLKSTGITLADLIRTGAAKVSLRRGENAATDPLGVLEDEEDDNEDGFYDDEVFMGDGQEVRDELAAAQLEMME